MIGNNRHARLYQLMISVIRIFNRLLLLRDPVFSCVEHLPTRLRALRLIERIERDILIVFLFKGEFGERRSIQQALLGVVGLVPLIIFMRILLGLYDDSSLFHVVLAQIPVTVEYIDRDLSALNLIYNLT